MKDILPSPPPIVRNQFESVRELFDRYVVPSYGRFELALSHGSGSWLYDTGGRRYLDLGGGIAVCSLGHAHPAITEALIEQSRKLVHVSNLYYQEPQGRLAEAIVQRIGPGKIFFCNSGAEANEGLFKLARRFGHDEGRFEIITALNSFHGRTLAGISATGQEKVKKGFEPMVPGFRQVPFNDLEAMRSAISPATVAILIEGVQGEGGVTPATPEYLLGLRKLCAEKKLLLLMDGVQCGHFRTGRFQSFQRILEGRPDAGDFIPDGIAMAKSMGSGFPMGAFWVRDRHADILSAGTHGTTYGGSPLACAVALRIMKVIEQEGLEQNARRMGDLLKSGLEELARKHSGIIRVVRGLGLMIGIELQPGVPGEGRGRGASPAARVTNLLQDAGVLVIPAGTQTFRLLPALNLQQGEAERGIEIIESVIKKLG
jgi:acetylornithine aminotransferase/acetylornithine/N-succinyldiaminopimelate aminotransferase